MNALHLTFLPSIGNHTRPAARRHYGSALSVAAVLMAGVALLVLLGGGAAGTPDTALQVNAAPSSIEIDPFGDAKKNALIEELPAQF